MDGAIAPGEDHVATIPVPPLLDEDARASLTSAIDRAGEDDATRVVLLVAQSGDFGIGEPETADAPLLERRIDPLLDPWRALRRLRKPAVAALTGRVENGSAALALACDLRLGDDSATIRFDAVMRGTLATHGSAPLLSRIVGPARAADMLLTARTIGADEAVQLSLLNRVVEGHKLAEAARELARRLAMSAPLALQYAKEAVVAGCDLPLEAGCRLEHDLYLLLQATNDRSEGLAAFFGKRPPMFRGE